MAGMSMDLRVLCMSLFLALSGVRPNPGVFNLDFYLGPTPRAIVGIFHGSAESKEPKCYGTLVNYQVAVVPCSCVVKPLSPDQEGVWYDQSRKFPVSPEATSALKAVLMGAVRLESPVINRYTAPVSRITLDPKCDSGFQYNVARIELAKRIPFSRIAWVANPFQDRMKQILDTYSIGATFFGICNINRWMVPQNITPTDDFPARIDLVEVTFVQWTSCINAVCPSNVVPPGGKSKNLDQHVCTNQVSKSRLCVEWNGAGSLCDVTPGTPVFCNAGRLVGFAGFIHNASMWCNPYVTTKQAVMEGIDLALPLIKNDLRVLSQFKNRTGVRTRFGKKFDY